MGSLFQKYYTKKTFMFDKIFSRVVQTFVHRVLVHRLVNSRVFQHFAFRTSKAAEDLAEGKLLKNSKNNSPALNTFLYRAQMARTELKNRVAAPNKPDNSRLKVK
eukprot:c40111_g1_i1.p1 GENE.c40111_g1_i1~~c40111_g1_i1.p1  ORF type:complete len:105 (-),score=15.75 c40111_g1_i1:35-349(-)